MIATWLRIRIPISNWLNRFDRWNVDLRDPLRFDSPTQALDFIGTLGYRFRYDRGDRIRTPQSVWNRARKGILRDDCDGMAVLATECLDRAGVESYLLTVVGRNFWRGHTVCAWSRDAVWYVYDYGVITTHDSIQLAALDVAKRTGMYGRLTIAVDYFDDGEWNNLSIWRK